MQRRPYNKKNLQPTLMCSNSECDNISSKLCIVENKIIKILKEWLKEYKVDLNATEQEIENKKITTINETIKEMNEELEKQHKKMSNIYDFLEDGTYSKELFEERRRAIQDKVDKININIEYQKKEIEKEKRIKEDVKIIIPKIENVIDIYSTLENPEEKNLLLKTVVKKIEYLKTEKAIKKNSDPEKFELDIYPILNGKI